MTEVAPVMDSDSNERVSKNPKGIIYAHKHFLSYLVADQTFLVLYLTNDLAVSYYA
jgi:hypothetical protein